MSCVAVIPARYGSTRFPGKPLALVAGRPLVWHVARSVCDSGVAELVRLSTDDLRIAAAVEGLALDVVIDRAPFRCGSDRVAAAVGALGLDPEDRVLNIQGDELSVNGPLMAGALKALAQGRIGTVASRSDGTSAEMLASPHHVELVPALDEPGRAADFRRCGLDDVHTGLGARLLHVGVYAFRASCLAAFSALPPGAREQQESLEQLRALEAGWPIGFEIVRASVAAVNCPEDLVSAERQLARPMGERGSNRG